MNGSGPRGSVPFVLLLTVRHPVERGCEREVPLCVDVDRVVDLHPLFFVVVLQRESGSREVESDQEGVLSLDVDMERVIALRQGHLDPADGVDGVPASSYEAWGVGLHLVDRRRAVAGGRTTRTAGCDLAAEAAFATGVAADTHVARDELATHARVATLTADRTGFATTAARVGVVAAIAPTVVRGAVGVAARARGAGVVGVLRGRAALGATGRHCSAEQEAEDVHEFHAVSPWTARAATGNTGRRTY